MDDAITCAQIGFKVLTVRQEGIAVLVIADYETHQECVYVFVCVHVICVYMCIY